MNWTQFLPTTNFAKTTIPEEGTKSYNEGEYEEEPGSSNLFYKKQGTSEFKYLNKGALNLRGYVKLTSMFNNYKNLYRASFALALIGLILIAVGYKDLPKNEHDYWYYTTNGFIGVLLTIITLNIILFFIVRFHQIEGLIETTRAVTNIYGANIANNDIHFAAGKLLARNSGEAASLGNAFLNKYGSGAAGTLVNSLNATGNESFDTVSEPTNYAKNPELDKAKQALYEANLVKSQVEQLEEEENALEEQVKEIDDQIDSFRRKQEIINLNWDDFNSDQKDKYMVEHMENEKQIIDLSSKSDILESKLEKVKARKEKLDPGDIDALEGKVTTEQGKKQEKNYKNIKRLEDFIVSGKAAIKSTPDVAANTIQKKIGIWLKRPGNALVLPRLKAGLSPEQIELAEKRALAKIEKN